MILICMYIQYTRVSVSVVEITHTWLVCVCFEKLCLCVCACHSLLSIWLLCVWWLVVNWYEDDDDMTLLILCVWVSVFPCGDCMYEEKQAEEQVVKLFCVW